MRLSGLGPVKSPSRITLENNGKIRPRPDPENLFAGASGGGDGSDIQPSLPIKSLLFIIFVNFHVVSRFNRD